MIYAVHTSEHWTLCVCERERICSICVHFWEFLSVFLGEFENGGKAPSNFLLINCCVVFYFLATFCFSTLIFQLIDCIWRVKFHHHELKTKLQVHLYSSSQLISNLQLDPLSFLSLVVSVCTLSDSFFAVLFFIFWLYHVLPFV